MLDIKLKDKIPCSEIRKRTDHRYHIIHTETKVEMGRSYSKIKGQYVDKTMHRVATKKREEVERTTKQKMAR